MRGRDSALGVRAPHCRGLCVEGKLRPEPGRGGRGGRWPASRRGGHGGAKARFSGKRGCVGHVKASAGGRGQQRGRPSHGDQAAPATPARRTEAIGHVPAAWGPPGLATRHSAPARSWEAASRPCRPEAGDRRAEGGCGGASCVRGRGRPRTGPRVLGPCGRVERERRPEVRGHRPRFTPEAGGGGGRDCASPANSAAGRERPGERPGKRLAFPRTQDGVPAWRSHGRGALRLGTGHLWCHSPRPACPTAPRPPSLATPEAGAAGRPAGLGGVPHALPSAASLPRAASQRRGLPQKGPG